MIQTNLPGDTVGLPFYSDIHLSQEQGMCAPVSQTRPDSSVGELAGDSTYLPGNTSNLGLLRVRQAPISYNCTPPMWRYGVSLEGCCI